MELFDRETGHITDAGFAALLDGSADEMARLELAEHLSFCDSCCTRYAALLAGEALLTPPHPAAPAVMERVRRRGRAIFLRQGFKVGLAACLALALWGAGLAAAPLLPLKTAPADLSARELQQQQTDKAKKEIRSRADQNSEKANLNMKISAAVDQFLSSLNHKGASQK